MRVEIYKDYGKHKEKTPKMKYEDVNPLITEAEAFKQFLGVNTELLGSLK